MPPQYIERCKLEIDPGDIELRVTRRRRLNQRQPLIEIDLFQAARNPQAAAIGIGSAATEINHSTLKHRTRAVTPAL